MAEKQNAHLQPAMSMPQRPLQSKAPQKVIIIKSSPALGVHGIKRKLDCSSGNVDKVQKPSETLLTSCSSLPTSLVAETRGKNIILFNKGSKPLICSLPKSSVLQNRNPVTAVTQSTGPALPKIAFIHKNSQLIKTANEAVVGKTLSKEPPIIPRQLCIGGGTDLGHTKPIRKGIFILRGKKVDGVSSNNMFKPVAFTLGQLINRPQSQASYSSPKPYRFPMKDSSRITVSFSQSSRNAESTLTTAVPIASKGSATCQDPKKSSESFADLSDITTIVDNTMTSLPKNNSKDEIKGIPMFRQYYAIHCPFHADFNTYTKYLTDDRRSSDGDEPSEGQQDLGAGSFQSWSGTCPICCSYCVSVCGSTDELFDHMNAHKPWLQFVDVACHLCPLDKHLPTMQKLEFQGWCSWRSLRLSMLDDHLYTSHEVDPTYERNPHEQVYDVLIDPAKVKSTDSNSVRFICPLEFAKHMMRHFHVLGCRLVCSICLRKNNGFGDVQGEGENDLIRLEQHYWQFHPMDLDSIPIVFQLRVRPGRLKKPNQREIASKYQMVLTSVKSCFTPKSGNVATTAEFPNATELDHSADMGDFTIPQIQCPFQSSGCEFRTSKVGQLTDHMDWHFAAIPLRWRVSCHMCFALFDNFLDAMLHLSQKICSSVIVKVLVSCSDPATEVGRDKNIEDCFSKPLAKEVTQNTLNCHSVSSDVLAQKYVDGFRSPEVDLDGKPANYHSVLSIDLMGLFIAVKAPTRSNICSSKWAVIRDDHDSRLSECQWQRLPAQVQLKKSVALSSSPAFEIGSVVSSKTGAEDSRTLWNVSKIDQPLTECSEKNSELRTITVPSHVFNQLLGKKSASSSVQQVKLLVNANNNLQPQLQKVVQSSKTVAAKSKCGSKLSAQMLNKSILLKNKTIRVEPFRPKAVPIVDTSKNLNRSTYAEIETLFIGQQYGINENVKVIIKEIDSELQYQCPYCIYNSQSIFDVANHLVQEHDNADLELNDTNSIHLKTHTLLMHCRLCDFVTHHHASLLWHLQNIHDILDEPLTLNDNPVKISEAAALESKRTPHFRCMRFDECTFASTSISAVAQHSYQAHAGDSNMFGISHVICNKVSFGVHHDDPSDVRITAQVVCAHCHVVTSSRKMFAAHYLYEHASRLLYICMYCEAHLNSLAAIIKHIDYRHAGFERLICSVMFIGDLGEDETAITQHEQTPNVVDTAAKASSMVVRYHGQPSVFSIPCADVRLSSINATGLSEVHQSASFPTNSCPASPLVTGTDAGSADSTVYANVTKVEGSKSCVVTYKGRELWLPYSIVAPLLNRP